MNKSKTLVIHPKDETTDCLAVIYKDRGWDVINDPSTPKKDVIEAIESHDRIIMLGHGTPHGLLAAGKRGRFDHYIIDDSMVELLATKDTFSIWCNSDQYFKLMNIPGLHTGMIISETVEELMMLSEVPLNKVQMAKNMELFCGAFAKYIDLEPEEMKLRVLEEYSGEDRVTKFNRGNIIVIS